MTPTDPNEKLEQAIARTVQSLPPRRAPLSLEQRVLAEIERRAALPWWRKSFRDWPVAARAAFVVASIGLVRFALLASEWVRAGFDPAPVREAFAQPYAWVEATLSVAHATTGFFEIMARNIPTLWVYGGVAFFVGLYVALFGLGAVAYKALQTQR